MTWRTIEVDPKYEVSDKGQIRHIKRRYRRLSQYFNKYYKVALYPNGKQTTFLVHFLVLTAFKGPRPVGHVADHINRNRRDNRVENLRWVTYSDSLVNRGPMPVGDEWRRARVKRG